MNRLRKLNKKQAELELSSQETEKLKTDYFNRLDTDPEYALEIDPTNKYGFHETEKDFIRFYMDFKNVLSAGELAGIDEDTAKELFKRFDVQSEIRRLSVALYQKQFAKKLLSLDQIGGYLSSLLTGENVPLVDQLKTNEKLRVVELLIRLNEINKGAMQDPSIILEKDIDYQLKDLSVGTIKQLLSQSNRKSQSNDKEEIIDKLDPDGVLSIEEKSYLNSLSTQELLTILEDTNKNTRRKKKS